MLIVFRRVRCDSPEILTEVSAAMMLNGNMTAPEAAYILGYDDELEQDPRTWPMWLTRGFMLAYRMMRGGFNVLPL